MRRDRQMFPPRQLLHAAATRGEAASDLPKKERKKEDARRKEEKSIFPVSLLPRCVRPVESSPWTERVPNKDILPLSLSFPLSRRKDPRRTRTRGWTAAI